MRLDVVVVYNDNAEYQRLFFVYAADIPEAVREPFVEVLLLAYEIPNVDVAYVDGPYAPQRAEHLIEGHTVLVYTVGNEQVGNIARRIPGRP